MAGLFGCQRTSAIGIAVKSNGTVASPADWRANRLADAIVKDAALARSAPPRVRQLLQDASAAAEYCCARIGSATHVANNVTRSVPNRESGSKVMCCRDSRGKKRNTGSAKRSIGLATREDGAAPVSPCRTKLSVREMAFAHEAINRTGFWCFITAMCKRNRNLGIPPTDDGSFGNLLIFDDFWGTVFQGCSGSPLLSSLSLRSPSSTLLPLSPPSLLYSHLPPLTLFYLPSLHPPPLLYSPSLSSYNHM